MTKREKTETLQTYDDIIKTIERRADGMGYPIDTDKDYIELCRLITFVEPFASIGRTGYLTKAKKERIEWLCNYCLMVLDYEEMKRGEA